MTRGQILQKFPKLPRLMALFSSLIVNSTHAPRVAPATIAPSPLATQQPRSISSSKLSEVSGSQVVSSLYRKRQVSPTRARRLSSRACSEIDWGTSGPQPQKPPNTLSLGDKKITSASTERQKRSQNLAPVLVINSVNSLVFSRKIITSAGLYRCCTPGTSAPVVVKNLSHTPTSKAPPNTLSLPTGQNGQKAQKEPK